MDAGNKRLTPHESDRAWRIAVAFQRTVDLFDGNAETARCWFNTPSIALGGHSPIEYLDTEAGASEIHDLIGRLEHGVII